MINEYRKRCGMRFGKGITPKPAQAIKYLLRGIVINTFIDCAFDEYMLKLVDELMTSDDYLMAAAAEKSDLFEVKYEVKRSLMQKLPMAVQGLLNRGSTGI